jgi:hypothetical protein
MLTAEKLQQQVMGLDNGLILNFSEAQFLPKLPPMPFNGGKGTRAVKGSYDGILFDSYAECVVYLYFKFIECSIVERNSTVFIKYTSVNGSTRKFYPDFIINGQAVEVKGRYFSNDHMKRQIENVRWIEVGSDEFKDMQRKVYKEIPNWREDYLKRGGLQKT